VTLEFVFIAPLPPDFSPFASFVVWTLNGRPLRGPARLPAAGSGPLLAVPLPWPLGVIGGGLLMVAGGACLLWLRRARSHG
jgi:hypothetical protein